MNKASGHSRGKSANKPGPLWIALLSGSALVSPAPVLAQSADSDDPALVLDTLTVEARAASAIGPDDTIVAARTATGSKTDTALLDLAAAVSVVTEAEMERRGVEDLQQALSYTSSVSVDEYGSDDRFDYYRIRGFYQTTLGSYRDGLSMRIPGFTASRLETYGLQRVEVLKGSTSTLFGLNGPGGLVNAITKRPQDYPFGEVYTTLGDEHVETGTDLGGPIDDAGEWSYRLIAKWQDGDNGAEHTQDDRTYIAPALTWQPSEATSLTLLADYNEREGNTSHAIPYGSGIDPETYLGEPDFDSMDTTEYNLGYVFEHDFGNGLSFQQHARHTDLELTYESVYGATPDPAARRFAYAVYGDTQRLAIDNRLQYETSLSEDLDSRTLVGVDYGRDEADETRYFGGSAAGIDIDDPNYCGRDCVTLGAGSDWTQEQTSNGFYLQEELTFDEDWIVTLGGRYDEVNTVSETDAARYDVTDYAFTRRLGLTYKATENLSLYTNYSESFQPLSANRTLIEGSPEPQEGEQYEVGMKYRPAMTNALFTLALFDLTQSNVAETVSPTTQRQVGEINVRGVELEAKLAMSERLNLTAAYSYWDSEIVNDGGNGNEGNRPQLVPEHLASLWADYTIPGNGERGDLTLGLGTRFVGSSYSDNANTAEVSSHTVFDAMANYRLTRNVELAVNATNLFDREYIADIDTFTNSAYYGDGRTLRTTLKYRW
ncbi:TonB-dependent siderophore receptor [Halomonas sp. HP20-15]|uniref:TonB-dependent siderophore receptor n=1 Tax=Halomonas sp. HP20-15 TaxID=3085901 RepID=UPI0029829129|nr:TonB-dependent siderophore receptor [Halomonas sp. HP20-15]MDW5376425.1 TonB-dependent siderophore receptor [Halomonas sp. HP20-15]